MMSGSPEPDYMKLYDNVRNQNEKLRTQVEQLTIERDQAIKDCARPYLSKPTQYPNK